MYKAICVDEFLSVSDSVIIDVRTPAEFEMGHIPNAINIPIFTNDQRIEVGTIYVKVSKERAVERGLELVGPKLAEFVREAKRVSDGKKIHLYCWRGGMRSGSMAWLFDTAGLNVAVLKGGYKAYRRNFDTILTKNWKFMVVGGPTGSGKTDILHQLTAMGEQVLDLEGLANHKGSAFGALGQNTQPTTEEFINRLHTTLRGFDNSRRVWTEGESITIGSVFIPQNLFQLLSDSASVNVTMDSELRLQRSVKEYGNFSNEELIAAFGRIQKRLGLENARQAIEFIENADIASAARIALKYYDNGYSKSNSKRKPIYSFSIHLQSDEPELNAKKLIEICK